MEAKMTKRLYSSFETVEMDPLASRFVTFELDLTGDQDYNSGSYFGYKAGAAASWQSVTNISFLDELNDIFKFNFN